MLRYIGYIALLDIWGTLLQIEKSRVVCKKQSMKLM